MLPLRSSVWILALSMLACGGQTNDLEGSSTATGGSAAGGSGSGGTGTGGSADVCESFDDEQGSHVDILISNQTAKPIYLGPFTEGSCSPSVPLFSIEQDGQPLAHFSDPCSATCGQLRDQGYLLCPDVCWQPETIELAPGEGYGIAWSALILTQRTLPVDCVEAEYGPESDVQCSQRTQITAGTYTFAARAGTEVICDEWRLPEECGPCTPTASGGCVHSGHHVGGETLQAETAVDLGPAYGIGGSEPASGANYPIEIVFSD